MSFQWRSIGSRILQIHKGEQKNGNGTFLEGVHGLKENQNRSLTCVLLESGVPHGSGRETYRSCLMSFGSDLVG